MDWRARPRLQPDRARILGASRVWDQDWGLPRVKCGTGGCNPTLCQPEAGLVTSWSERSERSDENPVRWLALQSTSDPLRLQLYNTRGGRPPLLSVAAALCRWRWWQVGEVCGVLYPSLAIPHTVSQLMDLPRLTFWRMLRESRPSHVSALPCVADSQRTESLPQCYAHYLQLFKLEGNY